MVRGTPLEVDAAVTEVDVLEATVKDVAVRGTRVWLQVDLLGLEDRLQQVGALITRRVCFMVVRVTETASAADSRTRRRVAVGQEDILPGSVAALLCRDAIVVANGGCSQIVANMRVVGVS